MIHELKIWPEYFQRVAEGIKTFEIRKNDRNFKVGDILLLKEYKPTEETYTGREFTVEITYVLDYFNNGYVVMSIKPWRIKPC